MNRMLVSRLRGNDGLKQATGLSRSKNLGQSLLEDSRGQSRYFLASLATSPTRQQDWFPAFVGMTVLRSHPSAPLLANLIELDDVAERCEVVAVPFPAEEDGEGLEFAFLELFLLRFVEAGEAVGEMTALSKRRSRMESAMQLKSVP